MMELLSLGGANNNSKEYLERSEVLVRRPNDSEDDCEFILEYINSEPTNTSEEIYEFGVRSIFSPEVLDRITDFSIEAYTFENTDSELVKVSVLEEVISIEKVFQTNGHRAFFLDGRPESEEVSNLSVAAQYQVSEVTRVSDPEGVIKEGETGLTDVWGEWSELGMSHTTEIHPGAVQRVTIPGGLENRIPVLRGMVLYRVNRNGSLSMDELYSMISDSFGVPKEEAELYVTKLDELCDDVSLRGGVVSI